MIEAVDDLDGGVEGNCVWMTRTCGACLPDTVDPRGPKAGGR